MLQEIDWHLNCSWMSQLLTFQDLNALSLTNKQLSSFANGARMLKVREWVTNSNEGERVWIEHYKQNYPTIINPASRYLKCLRYRHICADHFRNIVRCDPRLTERQQNELASLPLDTQPSKLFYWFVVELLPRRPLRINFSLELLQRTLKLPYGQEIIRNTNIGKLFLFLNKRGDIVISNDDGLLAVVTKDSHLWFTGLWTEKVSSFFILLCSCRPEVIVTAYSSKCPFCGHEVYRSCSHSMWCMKNYARWAGGLQFDNRLEIDTK